MSSTDRDDKVAHELIAEHFDRDDTGRLRSAFATALADARTEGERNFVNNVAAVLDADDAEAFTVLVMKAQAHPDLNRETRSALKSEAEIRAEVWKEAIAVLRAQYAELQDWAADKAPLEKAIRALERAAEGTNENERHTD